MGSVNSTKNYKERRFLHRFKYRENKLLVFFQDSRSVTKFELFLQRQKYKFWAQQTIALTDGSLYIIGGRRLFELDSIEEDLLAGKRSYDLTATKEVFRINLSKSINDNRIELSASKLCDYLPEARYNHLLLYDAPYIYVIGGQGVNSTPMRSCLRFHTKTKRWSPIRSFDLPNSNLANLAGINTGDQKLYVFDSTLEPLPRVYQYNIETDLWVQIVIRLKNRGIFIPTSINTSIFQISENKLLILSAEQDFKGESKQESQRGYSYFFNLTEEKIEDFRFERTLIFSGTNSQGNRDFRDSDQVFVSFDEKSVDLFDKRMGICDRMDLNEASRSSPLIITRKKNGPALISCGSALCGL